MYLCLCWVFVSVLEFSLVAESRSCSLLVVYGPLLLQSEGSRASGLQ